MPSLQGATSETINNLRAIKSNAAERFFIRRWLAKSNEAIGARWRILDLSYSYTFSLGLLTEILTLLVVLVGCLRILNGDLTIGGLLALQLLISRAVNANVDEQRNPGAIPFGERDCRGDCCVSQT
nr:ABC transporter transmembrane domain-containing protein [Mesorhizobium loti]